VVLLSRAEVVSLKDGTCAQGRSGERYPPGVESPRSLLASRLTRTT
jgi:hypothetical protein